MNLTHESTNDLDRTKKITQKKLTNSHQPQHNYTHAEETRKKFTKLTKHFKQQAITEYKISSK